MADEEAHASVPGQGPVCPRRRVFDQLSTGVLARELASGCPFPAEASG